MAYTQSPVAKTAEAAPDRQNMISVSWNDSEAQTTSEGVVQNLPKRGIIKRLTATLVSGTAATINPVVGRAAGFSPDTQDQVIAAPGAAAHIDLTGPFYYYASEGALYIVGAPNAGTDNVISYEMLIVPGWND